MARWVNRENNGHQDQGDDTIARHQHSLPTEKKLRIYLPAGKQGFIVMAVREGNSVHLKALCEALEGDAGDLLIRVEEPIPAITRAQLPTQANPKQAAKSRLAKARARKNKT